MLVQCALRRSVASTASAVLAAALAFSVSACGSDKATQSPAVTLSVSSNASVTAAAKLPLTAKPTSAKAARSGSAKTTIANVDWPTTKSQIDAILASMPTKIDGLDQGSMRCASPMGEPTACDAATSMTVSYGNHTATAFVQHAQQGGNPQFDMLSMLVWAGGPAQVRHWDSSATLANWPQAATPSLLSQLLDSSRTATKTSSGFAWFQCIQLYDAQTLRSLPASEREYLIVWTSGPWVYGVTSKGRDLRDPLVRALARATESG